MRNDETFKTMQEIADILKVSKPTLFRYLKANSIQETFKKQNANMYDETTVKAIIEGFNKERDRKNPDLLNNKKTDKDDIINGLKDQIEILKKHDEEQREQIQKLYELIDQQQKLLLYEQQKNVKKIEEDTDKKRWWHWWK